MKLRITSIGILQTAKTAGALYGVVGLIFGVFAFFIELFVPSGYFAGPSGIGPAILALILGPIVYAIGGFVAFAIGGWLYNLVAARTGGVELEATHVGADVL
jgi:hypothetical protein